MKNLKKKVLLGLTLGVFFVTMISVNAIIGVNANSSFNTLDGIISSAVAQAESTSYKGPLCSNQSGTVYCCKGSSGSCSAGAKCSSCQ